MPLRFRCLQKKRKYRMGYIGILCLLLASFSLCIGDELCPSSSVISPCTCDGEGMNCMKVKTDSEIQRVMRSIPKPWKFRAIWIQITDITTLPAGMFNGLQVQAFHIEVNKIRTVQKGAFSGSEQALYSLSVFGNQLTSFPFEDLKNFVYIQSFNAGRNKITSIPDNAFSGHQYLSQILLPENQITYIGANAFNQLPNLARLDLLHNRMATLGPLSFAMSAHNPQLQVNLANCTITSVSPTAFRGMVPQVLHLAINRLEYLEEAAFLPMTQKMGRIGGQIVVAGNPLSCKGCSYRWIVSNKLTLLSILSGFQCMDGRMLSMLNSWNIMC